MSDLRLPDPVRPVVEPGPLPTPTPVSDGVLASWFRRMPNGGTVFVRDGGGGGETGTAGDPTK